MNVKRYERIRNTVEFFPHNTKTTFIFSTNRAYLAAADLTDALIHTKPEKSFSHIGEIHLSELIQISTLFHTRLNKPGERPRVVHTETTESVSEPEPPRVETPAPPRVARRINAQSTRVGTIEIISPTM